MCIEVISLMKEKHRDLVQKADRAALKQPGQKDASPPQQVQKIYSLTRDEEETEAPRHYDPQPPAMREVRVVRHPEQQAQQ